MKFLLALLFCAQAALAAPSQVILIRHGEKPAEGNELNERGWQRARALVNYFKTDPGVTRFGPPVAIFAMAPKDEDGSLRPIQTVTPLAESLGLTINSGYKKKQIQKMVDAVMSNPRYEGKMVLICWEHKVIPEIAQAFGASTAPSEWPGGDVYDRTWVLSFAGGKVLSFADLPQHLLPGDSDE
jgi:hypothetical protein